MKKKLYSVFLFAIVISFINCDKVAPRVPAPKGECTFSSAKVLKNNFDKSDTRKVLLEDYTGHTCGQCPPAIAKAKELNDKYKNQLVVIANHVSVDFAAPKTKAYFEDFRDISSTEWDKEFGMSAAGLPRGSVNRAKINGNYPQNYNAWEAQVINEIATPQSVKLNINTEYDPTQNLLLVKVLTTFKTSFNFDVNLSMILSQDSIIADQKDYNPPSGVQLIDIDRRPDFEFEHIMVKSLNGTWGQLLKKTPIAANDTITVTKNCNLTNKCFYKDIVCTNDKHLYLIVFASNASTKEILQVEKLKIR